MSKSTNQQLSWIELDLAFKRLKQNPDFKKVIEDFYLGLHRQALIDQLDSETMGSPTRASIVEQLIGIANFKNMFYDREAFNTLNKTSIKSYLTDFAEKEANPDKPTSSNQVPGGF